MPCRTCKDKLSKVEGAFRMRFVCDTNGRLLKGAPSNFKCGQVYIQPFRLSKFPYWELIEETPKLVIPSPSEADSVFDDAVYIPDDDVAPIEMNTKVKEVGGVNVDPDAPAILEPYMRLNLRTGKLTAVPDELKQEEISEADLGDGAGHPSRKELGVWVDKPSKTREELKEILKEAKVEYSDKARTSTLQKMVDELAPKE